MTDREAISNFEKRNFWLKVNPCCQRTQSRVDKQNSEIERNVVAISALRERMEREGGCLYCERALSITSGFLTDSHISKIHGLSGTVTYALCINGSEYQRIDFCPMCGRKLTGTDANVSANTQPTKENKT